MRRVKDYVVRYNQSKTFETLRGITEEFLLEIDNRLGSKRYITNFALVPIIDSLSQSWVKFANLVNRRLEEKDQINPAGFINSLKHARPKVYEKYMTAKLQLEISKLKQFKRKHESMIPAKDSD